MKVSWAVNPSVDQPILERLAARLDDLPREKVIARILSLYRERQGSWQERHTALQRDLAMVEASVQRLLDLLCHGGQGIDALVERLKEEEAKKKVLQAELEQGAASPPPVKNLEAEIRQRLADTRGLLRKDLPVTR